MKIIKKTRKYLHVRMTEEEYRHAKMHLDQWEQLQKHREWFLANHERKTGTDDYGSYESYWVNKETGQMVPDPGGLVI
jgi:hypothetical protein